MGASSFWSSSRTDFMGETGSLLAHLGRSKNEPGLEIFLLLYDKKFMQFTNELKVDQK